MPQAKGTRVSVKNVKTNDIIESMEDDALYQVCGVVGGGNLSVCHVVVNPDNNTHRFVFSCAVDPEFSPFAHTGETYREPPEDPLPVPVPEELWSPETARNGWLSPRGELYVCDYAGHRRLAALLVHHRGYKDTRPRGQFSLSNDDEIAVENAGYLKLAWSHAPNAEPMWYVPGDLMRPIKPTSRQRDAVFAWCMACKQDIPYDFEDDAKGMSVWD